MRHSFALRALEVDLILFGNEIAHGTRYFDVLSVFGLTSRGRETGLESIEAYIPRRARIIGKHSGAKNRWVDE